LRTTSSKNQLYHHIPACSTPLARSCFVKVSSEKSHACVVSYLREHYSSELGQDKINWLDTYRLERHESFYGLEKSSVDEHEVEDALEKSEKFLETIQQIIIKLNKKS
jgi:uncharacterized protein (UPF0332 family)